MEAIREEMYSRIKMNLPSVIGRICYFILSYHFEIYFLI